MHKQQRFPASEHDRQTDWNPTEAALRGSSYYQLPAPLRWITANIGVHHVHHVSSRIPFYRLPSVLRDYPELKSVGKLTLLDSIRSTGLSLWDEAEKRLISFAEYRRAEKLHLQRG